MKILDCTLRDGGYYNNWDFDEKLVSLYLSSIAEAGVECIELGLRSLHKEGFYGAYAYTLESFLSRLSIPSGLSIAVMLDAKTVLQANMATTESVNKLFQEAEKSVVTLVRIATLFDDLDECMDIAAALKQLGYKVAINLMQISGKKIEEIGKAGKIISGWETVDVIYFADSFGNMKKHEVATVIASLRKHWAGDLGIHTHNNMGRANDNSLEAIRLGVEWVDATVTGMGRGAGNAQTEILLDEVNAEFSVNYHPEALYELILEHFYPMQKKLGWGCNFAYHFSANHHIHPSFPQELISDPRYSPSDVISALDFLSKNNAESYNQELFAEAFCTNSDEHEVRGEWKSTGWCKDEDILIIGSGSSLVKYRKEIESFITTTKIKALSVNVHDEIKSKYIYAYAAANNKRLVLDIKKYVKCSQPIFFPNRVLPKNILEELRGVDIRDYDMQVVPDNFTPLETGCKIPFLLSIAYAISLAISGNAKRIFFVGLDGYGIEGQRQVEMLHTFELIKRIYNPECLISLTPTNYPITQGSIYAPY